MTKSMTQPIGEGRGADRGYFEAEHSADVVNARIGEKTDPRLREIAEIFTRHLHAAVKEAALAPEEWLTGIRFLTETGQMCSEWRQEFILLSDVLGISMLVDSINHARPEGATENTVLGPFHVSGAPQLENGADINLDGKGEPLVVHGRVLDGDGNPVAGATLDVWQANDDGYYDVQQKGIQPEWNLRGIFRTDADGRYRFHSAKPRHYPIPEDGPVGRMLNVLGRHPNRAAHLHFIVYAPGFERVVTHIFTPDCPYLREDAVFGVKPSLVAGFKRVEDAQEAAPLSIAAPFWEVEWNFVLAPETVTTAKLG